MEELVTSREFKASMERGLLERIGKAPAPPAPPSLPPPPPPPRTGAGGEIGQEFWTLVLIAASSALLLLIVFFTCAPVERTRAFVSFFRALLSRSPVLTQVSASFDPPDHAEEKRTRERKGSDRRGRRAGETDEKEGDPRQ